MERLPPKFNLEQLSDYMLHKLEQEILIIKTTRAMRAEGLLPAKPKTRRTRTKKPLSGPASL